MNYRDILFIMIKISTIRKREDKENIVVLVDGLGAFGFLYFLIKKCIPSNYGYLQYSYPNKTLNYNSLKTKENFLQLIEAITKDLNKLEQIKHRNFYMFSCSLGGLFCMIVADKISIKKAMLVAPGYNLAEAFWFGLGKRTQRLKKKMISNEKITLSELKEFWKEISPDYYFKDKSLNTEFFIILSKKDKIIPISNGKQLVYLLGKEKIKHQILWTNLSHRLISAREILFTRNFKKWISEVN